MGVTAKFGSLARRLDPATPEPVPIRTVVAFPTILPGMPNAMNSTARVSRIGFAVCVLCGGTTLLLHPSVPRQLKALRLWASEPSITIFGYAAHATAYLAMTFTVLMIVSRFGHRTEIAAVAALLVHGILTETAQLMIPQRTWDPLDLMANLLSVLLASGLWGTLIPRATPAERPA